MKYRPLALLTAVSSLALALISSPSHIRAQATADRDNARPGHQSTGSERMSGMKERMQRMMDECQQQCDASARKCDQLADDLRQARNSNDPAKMRAAIDDLIKECEQMKNMVTRCTAENRKACMEMMGMMGRMQGMHDRMDGGMQMGSGMHDGMKKGNASGDREHHQGEPGQPRDQQRR